MLGKMFNNWASKKQATELNDFLVKLRGMDSYEIGMVVAVATHLRHGIKETFGYNLLDPIIVMGATPEAAFELSRLTRTYQKSGKMIDAAGLMIWVHTLRAAARPELRMAGRELWGQLHRGIDFVEENAVDMMGFSGIDLKLDGFELIPEGLNPEVR